MEWSRTGSKYDGRTKDRRMHGLGTYTFPTGSTYHGEFRDGEFHGAGTLMFTHGGKFVGEWRKGLAVEGRYIFVDELAMDDISDPYCLPGKDRRFQTERLNGLRPAGRCQMTNKEPPVTIPGGMYDVGKGFFDPNTEHVVDYKTMKFIGTTGPDTHKWVKDTCRKGWDEVVGFKQKDYSRPHPSDKSTWPPEREGEVDLPPEYERKDAKIPDRPPSVMLSLKRDSETQMACAVSGLESRVRRLRKGAEPSDCGVPPTWRLPRRRRAASLYSASTSGSEFCDGFDAVRRNSSEDFEKEREDTRERKEGEEEVRISSIDRQESSESEIDENVNAFSVPSDDEKVKEQGLPVKTSMEKMLDEVYEVYDEVYRPSWARN